MQLHSIENKDRELEALLDFYLASGIDCPMEEDAIDRFALTATMLAERGSAQGTSPVGAAGTIRPQGAFASQPSGRGPAQAPRDMSAIGQRQTEAPQNQVGGTNIVLPDALAVQSARDAAGTAPTLDALRECLAAFEGCNLRLTAKNLVFSDGNPDARVMFVGEAPGRDEDLQGRPFVGRSGQLLDKMLAAIKLSRSDVYIANVVPWRPPGNRTPTPQETEICKPFIARQIELVAPDILVFLGAASAKTFLGVQDGIRKLRGRWMTYETGSRQTACIATYHPAYLLRSPLEKRHSWHDFQSLRDKMIG